MRSSLAQRLPVRPLAALLALAVLSFSASPASALEVLPPLAAAEVSRLLTVAPDAKQKSPRALLELAKERAYHGDTPQALAMLRLGADQLSAEIQRRRAQGPLDEIATWDLLHPFVETVGLYGMLVDSIEPEARQASVVYRELAYVNSLAFDRETQLYYGTNYALGLMIAERWKEARVVAAELLGLAPKDPEVKRLVARVREVTKTPIQPRQRDQAVRSRIGVPL